MTKKISFAVFTAMALFSQLSFAEEENRNEAVEKSQKESAYSGYLGLLGGANSDTSSDAKTDGAMGLTLGAKVNPNFGIAFFGSYFGHTSDHSVLGLPAQTSTKTYSLMGQANFFAGGFHAGGEAGAGITSWTGSVSNISTGESNTAFIYGPEAGYDFKFSKNMSIGIEGHYLLTNADGGENNVQAFAALKFWN